VRRNLCSARRSAITCAQVANSESERCRRRGKTRQVMKNQRSDSTRRRSRDMRVIIALGSNPDDPEFAFPHQEPQRNAKSAYLCATRSAGDEEPTIRQHQRRSRDMRVIIALGSNPTIQNSRSPAKSRRGTQKARTSALPALLTVKIEGAGFATGFS
jgi:hypothetical protein